MSRWCTPGTIALSRRCTFSTLRAAVVAGFFQRYGGAAAGLKRGCTAFTAAIFTPADLIPLFESASRGLDQAGCWRGDPAVQAPPDWFDAELSLPFAAGMVGGGRVRFCAPVADKMKTQTIGAALAFKAGDAVEMALRAAFILAIGLKYDMRLTSRPGRPPKAPRRAGYRGLTGGLTATRL